MLGALVHERCCGRVLDVVEAAADQKEALCRPVRFVEGSEEPWMPGCLVAKASAGDGIT